MKIKNYFLLLIIFLAKTSNFCQGEIQFTLCHIDARFYKFNRNITVGLKERELKNYSTSYNLRFKKAFEAVLLNPQMVAKILDVAGVIDKNVLQEALKCY